MAETNVVMRYRRVLPDHACPFGVRGRQVSEQGVATDPEMSIDGERIGGSDDPGRYPERA